MTTTLDALVDATPTTRDRVVDLLRVVSLGVVVVWHWTLSITQWTTDGALTMPNPIRDLPGAWAATWVLQVMPVFFVVGGYANLAGWRAVTRDGGGAGRFLAARMRRLFAPLVPWTACWLVIDVVVRLAGGRSILDWGMAVLAPLWFLGVYAIVVAAVPLTTRLHRTWGWRVPAVLALVVLAADVVRLGAGWGDPVVGLVGSLAVWLFAHQLGYFWRDGTLLARGRRTAAVVAGAGFAALVLLTALGPYSLSMVSVAGEPMGNMFPTTAPIAALAVFQLGLALLARPWLAARLQRRRTWRAVVAANGLAMPVFVWHMTALVAFIWLYERAGFTLGREATAGWWLERPVWLVGPGIVLAAMLAVIARFRRRRGA
jgi:peptidoglycan/LPS O-acetylase OafA/YrhL